MPTPSRDAPLGEFPDDWIPALAELYEEFAHSFEPFSEKAENAERVFVTEIVTWWEILPKPKPSLQEFRKGVILRCRRYLAARDKPQDKQFLRKLHQDDPPQT